jgi:hypothetical protein
VDRALRAHHGQAGASDVPEAPVAVEAYFFFAFFFSLRIPLPFAIALTSSP